MYNFCFSCRPAMIFPTEQHQLSSTSAVLLYNTRRTIVPFDGVIKYYCYLEHNSVLLYVAWIPENRCTFPPHRGHRNCIIFDIVTRGAPVTVTIIVVFTLTRFLPENLYWKEKKNVYPYLFTCLATRNKYYVFITL